MYLFIGIFMDFIMLVAYGYPNNLAWIFLFIMPGVGHFLGLALYYRYKGLDWKATFLG